MRFVQQVLLQSMRLKLRMPTRSQASLPITLFREEFFHPTLQTERSQEQQMAEKLQLLYGTAVQTLRIIPTIQHQILLAPILWPEMRLSML